MRMLKNMGREAQIFPTRKDGMITWPREHKIRADYKCPIADLAAFYRRDLRDFSKSIGNDTRQYFWNWEESVEYREQLLALAEGRPIVGLACNGGVLTTARAYRKLELKDIERLIESTDAMFVSMDYDDMTPLVIHLTDKYGPRRFVWFPAIVQHWDYDHTAAFLAATDLNVLVCQSAAHLSAGIGANTRVLAPKRTAWREIKVGSDDKWYWWPHHATKLYMQEESGVWDGPINRVIEEINAHRNAISGRSAPSAENASLPSSGNSVGDVA
jgi:hypothetical protein